MIPSPHQDDSTDLPASGIQLAPLAMERACGVCAEGLEDEADRLACRSCDAAVHYECGSLVPACVTYGCKGFLAPPRRPAPDVPRLPAPRPLSPLEDRLRAMVCRAGRGHAALLPALSRGDLALGARAVLTGAVTCMALHAFLLDGWAIQALVAMLERASYLAEFQVAPVVLGPYILWKTKNALVEGLL